MEKEEIKGTLAMSGKEWVCYNDSTKKEIKALNPDFTTKEIESVYSIVSGINNSQ